MPPTHPKSSSTPSHEPRTADDVALAFGEYSVGAFYFIQEAIEYSAERIHGPRLAASVDPDRSRHITGQQLCEGLRELALQRWGLMARAVLATWGVHATLDFGRIVFAMIDAGLFAKQPSDSIGDFANVYDFNRAFTVEYRFRLPTSLD